MKIGRTEKFSNHSFKSASEKSGFVFLAFAMFSTALPNQLPPDLCSAARTFDLSTCSATFARLKKLLNALTSEIVWESVS